MAPGRIERMGCSNPISPTFPRTPDGGAEPPRHPDHAAVFADLDPELQGLVRSSPDSLLEGTGFELLVRGRVKLVVGRRRQRKSNGSTMPLSMRIGDLRSARTPHQGRRGKHIVVLDRWGEDRTEDAVSSLARSRPASVL